MNAATIIGRWLFSQDGDVTMVCYEWHVRTTKPWMNLVEPIARFLFKKNHDALMQNGAEGLARLLDVPLIAVSHKELPRGAVSKVRYGES